MPNRAAPDQEGCKGAAGAVCRAEDTIEVEALLVSSAVMCSRGFISAVDLVHRRNG